MITDYLFGVDQHLDEVGVVTYTAYREYNVNEEGILDGQPISATGKTPYEAIGSLCDIFIAKEIEDTKVVTYEVQQDEDKRFVVKSSKRTSSDVAKHDLSLTESWAIAKSRNFLLEWQYHYSRHNDNEKSEKISSDLQQIYDLEYALDEKERANESE